MRITKFLIIKIIILFNSFLHASEIDYVQYAKQRVQQAEVSQSIFVGPTTGPTILPNKSIIFVASDLRNGGVNSVAKGFLEATYHVNWNIQFLDAHGSKIRQGTAIRKAINLKPDGIVLCGIDAYQHAEILKIAKELNISIIGWHAIDEAKADAEIGLFTNITTDPKEVAEIAVLSAIADSDGKAKVVIFSDSNYSIASLKANKMIEQLQKCAGCKLLAVEDVPLDKTAQQMPIVVERLLTKYPEEITHFLVINDLYIDFSTPSLEAKLTHSNKLPNSISAGDGSRAAYKRISKGFFSISNCPRTFASTRLASFR